MRQPLNALQAVVGLTFSLILCGAFAEDATTQNPPAASRYPTAVVTDYVIGCLIANGQSAETLRKCSCSIDFIAAAVPYEAYERVEPLMRLRSVSQPESGHQQVHAARSVSIQTGPSARRAAARDGTLAAEGSGSGLG